MILVQKESYLLELTRYVVLNPLRVGMVEELEEWPWISYCATTGLYKPQQWLDTDWLLSQFGRDRTSAISDYRRFVMDDKRASSPLKHTRYCHLLLGDDGFISWHKTAQEPEPLRDASKAQKRAVSRAPEEYKQCHETIDEAMAQAYCSGTYTMTQIGDYLSRENPRLCRGWLLE